MDVISRQAAIEKILGQPPEPHYPSWYAEQIKELPPIQPEIVRCKDCKHFEYDYVVKVDGIPLIVAHEICMRWGDGVATSENGYCFLAERREVTT